MHIHPEHTFTTYTKHYYIGSERINSKLGTVKDLGVLCEQIGGNDLIDEMNRRAMDAGERLEDLHTDLDKDLRLNSPYLYSREHQFVCDFKSHNPELYDAYWYHPDHLGSSSYITNTSGEISQHMEYLPFGETLVEEHLNSYNSPFKFNGKEYDAETGNYYYGARYMNPKWSMWLGVDPLAEKYPGWSSYNYVLNNPLKYIDPDGMAVEDIIIKGSKKFINQTFANLQSLTDDTLTIDENGKVTISDSSCNSVCQVGGDLVSSLINNEDSTVTIVETSGGNKTKGGTKSEANLKSDGSPGSGVKEITIEFNPNKTTGGVDVNGSRERPTEIGLGHELIHSKNRVEGKRDPRDSGVRDPDRPKGQGKILSNEELNTRKAENKLRKERNLPLRKTKQ